MQLVFFFVLASGLGALTLTLAALGWWLWYLYSPFGRSIRRIPGPNPLPLVGSALHLAGGCDVVLKVLFEDWPAKYGEIFRAFIGSKVYVVISSPELLEPILTSTVLIDKGIDYQFVARQWLGDGLLISSGAKWKSRRRLLTPAFHFHIMEDFFDTFNEQSAVLCSKIEQLCHSSGHVEMEISECTSLCTLDVMCETAMGIKLGAQTRESEYIKAVQKMSAIVNNRMVQPWKAYDVAFALTKDGRDSRRYRKILHQFTDQVIKTRRQELQARRQEFYSDDEDTKKRRPFLDILLESLEEGVALGDRDVREEVDTFLFEGHDTTAQTINWFLYCMASNLECQSRVRDELDQIFGDSDRPCTRQDLPLLKYLECCIKETLRLFSTVPLILRANKQMIRIGTFEIPAGCDLAISIYALHRNPRIYPDPLVFNPDRFLLENSAGRSPYAFIPFSAGPRNCIGQRFAMAEEKVVLSSLLRKFFFELPCDAAKPVPSSELTLKSTTGVHLKISPR